MPQPPAMEATANLVARLAITPSGEGDTQLAGPQGQWQTSRKLLAPPVPKKIPLQQPNKDPDYMQAFSSLNPFEDFKMFSQVTTHSTHIPGNPFNDRQDSMNSRRIIELNSAASTPTTTTSFTRNWGNGPQSRASAQERSKPRDEVFIAVCGMTGVGKSTFISKVSGKSVAIGHNLHSCTSSIEAVPCEINGENVVLIDTPGFNDTDRSDVETLETIANWLRSSYDQKRLLSGIIYMHDISQTRVTGSEQQNIRLFRSLCGEQSMKNVMLLTSKWDIIDVKKGEANEEELCRTERFWGAMKLMGAQVRRLDETRTTARQRIVELLGNRPKTTQLQDEMAQGKPLIETAAGASLQAELLRAKKEFEKDLDGLRKEIQTAYEQKNKDLEKSFDAQYTKKMNAIERNTTDLQRLLKEKDKAAHSMEKRFMLQLESEAQKRTAAERQQQAVSNQIKALQNQQQAASNQINELLQKMAEQAQFQNQPNQQQLYNQTNQQVRPYASPAAGLNNNQMSPPSTFNNNAYSDLSFQRSFQIAQFELAQSMSRDQARQNPALARGCGACGNEFVIAPCEIGGSGPCPICQTVQRL